MLSRLTDMFTGRLSGLAEDQRRLVLTRLREENLDRLRVIAAAALVVLAALTAYDWLLIGETVFRPTRTSLAVRGLVLAGCLAYLLATLSPGWRNPRAKAAARLESLFTPFLVYGLAAVDGLSPNISQSNQLYVMTLFTAAAFLRLDGRRGLAVYFGSWLILAGLSLALRPDLAGATGQLASTWLMTFLALVTSRIIYLGRVKAVTDDWELRRQRDRLRRMNLELTRSNRLLKRMSLLDPLTTVPNRRYFDDILAREWRRAARKGTPLGMIMADIDQFKAFNDLQGHQAGDDCLIVVAWALTKPLQRGGDVLARYGGEEFAVILPETDTIGAALLAEKMRQSVADLALDHPGSTEGVVTVSFGAASLTPAADLTAEQLVGLADAALYRAKSAGRNRVEADDSAGDVLTGIKSA